MKLKQKNNRKPKRVVILGAGGFISAAVQRQLEEKKIPYLGISRAQLDLTEPGAGKNLQKTLNSEDTLLFVAAKAPVKTTAMMIENLKMGEAVCEVLRKTPVRHVVYISSDAVYADCDQPLTEISCAQPQSLHGIMHLARETMLSQGFSGPLSILRPTLIYGRDDPHNGYGPNRFYRLALRGQEIQLFGNGEERRDHIWVEDVAQVVCEAVIHQKEGYFNLATGELATFRTIAEICVEVAGRRGVKITTIPRVQPMPHGGFRPISVARLRASFPEFHPVGIRKGLEVAFR